MKVVIFVWTIDPYPYNMSHYIGNNKDGFWGIGDIIRGMISTAMICKKLNIEYYIDVFNHPISNYLDLIDYNYKEYVNKNINKVYWPGQGNTINYINTCNDDTPILIMTNEIIDGNVCPHKNIPYDVIENILALFKMNRLFEGYYLHVKHNIGLLDDYSIIHFRLGDSYLVRGQSPGVNFDSLYNKFLQNKEDNQLIISDCNIFKKFIKEKDTNAIMFDTKSIIHMGRTDGDIKDTLLEFMLILNSNNIKTFSIHNWRSGFVLYPSILKNIPIIRI